MTDELIIQRSHGMGHITLNRPNALNALSSAMIDGLTAILKEWASDPAIKTVTLSGAGRAFCAGGDIKAVYHLGPELQAEAAEFFTHEYALNRLMFHYEKPIIALMHGIVMGGGYGLAGQCRYRIAAPDCRFAMPEVGIGFFPDVGSAWHLSRMKRRSGFCLALTGMTVNAGDMLFTGVASHCIDPAGFGDLKSNPDTEAVLKTLKPIKPEKGEVEANIDLIESVFTFDNLAETKASLAASNDPFAKTLESVMASRAPGSLAVTVRHLSLATQEDFDMVIARDLDLAGKALAGHDFYEGIRAAVIDRDQSPEWKDG
jgi:enoyl-CoA hydratase